MLHHEDNKPAFGIKCNYLNQDKQSNIFLGFHETQTSQPKPLIYLKQNHQQTPKCYEMDIVLHSAKRKGEMMTILWCHNKKMCPNIKCKNLIASQSLRL